MKVNNLHHAISCTHMLVQCVHALNTYAQEIYNHAHCIRTCGLWVQSPPECSLFFKFVVGFVLCSQLVVCCGMCLCGVVWRDVSCCVVLVFCHVMSCFCRVMLSCCFVFWEYELSCTVYLHAVMMWTYALVCLLGKLSLSLSQLP